MVYTVLAQVSDIGSDVVLWALEAVKWIIQKFQTKEYGLAVSGIIMALVFAFNKYFKGMLSSKALPWVSAAIGVLTTVATKLAGLATGAQTMDWLSAIGMGLLAGATASGLWSLIGKNVVGLFNKNQPGPAPAPAPADPPPPTPGA